MHGTAISWQGKGVLLVGNPGAGKSYLARLMMDRGWSLVGDDQVHLIKQSSGVFLVGDTRLKGILEVRGLGITRVTPAPPAKLCLVVSVETPESQANQMPEGDARMPSQANVIYLGHQIPFIGLNVRNPGIAPLLETAVWERALS